MIISRKLIRLWLLLFLPFLLLVTFLVFEIEKADNEKTYKSVNRFIRTKFPIAGFADSSGQPVPVSLNAEYTIIDFWFKGCKPCIEEMKQFEKLLKGKGKKISILSVSTDPFPIWKKSVYGETKVFSFLRNLENWKHVAYSNDPKINPFQALSSQLSVKYYPAYFALNKKGIIVDAPSSAVKFIKSRVSGEPPFVIFIKEKLSTTDGITGSILAFIFYSGLFWITTILILSLTKLRKIKT
jgi:thiol-disulfide isomerase/thioredoxin